MYVLIRMSLKMENPIYILYSYVSHMTGGLRHQLKGQYIQTCMLSLASFDFQPSYDKSPKRKKGIKYTYDGNVHTGCIKYMSTQSEPIVTKV